MDNHIRCSINEDDWNFYLTDDDDVVISDEDAAAHTDFEAKEMFIRKGELNIRVIQHELFHIYFGYCYLSDTTSITLSDMEEIAAALFSDKGEKIIERSKDIYSKLLTLKEKLNESND